MNSNQTTYRDIQKAIEAHLMAIWPGRVIELFIWSVGPILPGFEVMRITPHSNKEPWVYVSCGAWQAETNEIARYEFFLLSPVENPANIEMLAMLANFHVDETHGGVTLGKIIALGRPWLAGSACDHVLVSLPYPLGPEFEYIQIRRNALKIRFLWVVPITAQEAEFAKTDGLEALEQHLEAQCVNFLDPKRRSSL